jgi:WD40 repeat protein
MGISPDGQWFAHATKYSATVRSANQWAPVCRIPHGDKGAVNSVDFSRDGRTMASAGGYGHVVMTRTSDWTEINDGLVENTSSIKSVRLSPDGQYAAAGYSGPGRVAVFDCATMRLVADIPLCYIEAVAWTSDNRYLLAGGRDGKGNMMLWRAGTWEPAGTLTAQLDGSNIEYIDCWQDRVAVAGEDARVRVWRME